MEHFAIIVNGFNPLTIFAKISILDIRLGSEYASDGYLRSSKTNYVGKLPFKVNSEDILTLSFLWTINY